MAKSTINPTQKKKRGRPPNPEGRRLSIPISFHPMMVSALDTFAEKSGITRSEAVRRLVELGLKAKGNRATAGPVK
jgi:hypothetical protein